MDNQSLGIALTLLAACILLILRHFTLRIGRDGWDPRRLAARWNVLAAHLALLLHAKKPEGNLADNGSRARTPNALGSGRVHQSVRQARNYREVPDAPARRPRVISAHPRF
jgi:hypothetical protein